MGTQLEAMGIQAGAQAIQDIQNTGMGLLLEGHNDKRQLKQQRKLNDLQLIANKDMADYNQQLQLKMWEATNYKAQKEQLIKAGLNPGLLYGMGGAGGATTGGAGGAGVSGAQAPSGGQEIMGMMMQKALLEAQTQNIKADTAKKQAETEKTKGVDTTEAQTRITSLTQGINNQKAQEVLTKIQAEIEGLRATWTEDTMEATIRKMRAETDLIQTMADITQETKEEKMNQIRQEATNAAIEGALMSQQIKVEQATIQKMGQEILQGWENLNIQDKRQRIEQKMLENNINYAPIDRIIKGVEIISDGLIMGKVLKTAKPVINKIGFNAPIKRY